MLTAVTKRYGRRRGTVAVALTAGAVMIPFVAMRRREPSLTAA